MSEPTIEEEAEAREEVEKALYHLILVTGPQATVSYVERVVERMKDEIKELES